MGANGSHKDILRGWLHNGAPRRHRIGRGACGRGKDHSVSGVVINVNTVSPHDQVNHSRHRTLGDDSIVQRQVSVKGLSTSSHRHVQHHSRLDCIFALGELGEHIQFAVLQFCHKADTAHIDPQNRDVVSIGVPRGMKDGAIPAKAEENIRPLQLILHVAIVQIPGQFSMTAPLL